ncbi:MAG: hypothetical protein AB7F86_15915 [Bdellovibrionales bacterium]
MVWLLLILFLVHRWHGPDVWYHLVWGRSIWTTGSLVPSPDVLLSQPIPANGYWLFQSVLYGLYWIGGHFAVFLLFLAAWLGIAWLWKRITQWDQASWGGWLFLLFVICMQLRFEERPEVFSYLLILLMVDRAWRGPLNSQNLWIMALIQVVWSNVHGYFVFGPLIATLLLLERSGWRSQRPWWTGLVLSLSTLITPFGYGVWKTVFLYARFSRELADLNQELFSPSLWPPAFPTSFFWIFVVAVAVTSVWMLATGRNFGRALLALLGCFLSSLAIRNMPLVFFFSAPLLSEWKGWRLTKMSLNPRWTNLSLRVVTAGLSVALVLGYYHRWVGSLSSFGWGEEWASYPIGAVEFLKEKGFRGKLFCDSYDGGYLEFHLPEIKVAGDSYFSDSSVTRRYFQAIRNVDDFVRLNQQFDFDGLLINVENFDVLDTTLNNPKYVMAYADSHRVLFLRAGESPKATWEQVQFYHGENLRDEAYAFGVTAWMALGFKRQDRELIHQLVMNLQTASAIPERAFSIAVRFAHENRDEDLVFKLAPMKIKLF